MEVGAGDVEASPLAALALGCTHPCLVGFVGLCSVYGLAVLSAGVPVPEVSCCSRKWQHWLPADASSWCYPILLDLAVGGDSVCLLAPPPPPPRSL